MTTTAYPPLIQRFVTLDSVIRLFLVLLGVAIISALAQLKLVLPFSPVPITGQTLGVLLIGASYGFSLGSLTLTSYLLLGALGLPLFADSSTGWQTVFGSSGGYLLGFILAAGTLGYLAERGWDRSYFKTTIAMLLANLLIYVPGLLWLSRSAPDWPTTIQWGLTPFIIGDILKLVLAVGILPTIWHLLGRQEPNSR
jgi:biotin transport system substrate-specific component